jgi:hypothetical protein
VNLKSILGSFISNCKTIIYSRELCSCTVRRISIRWQNWQEAVAIHGFVYASVVEY